ncbi:MAG: AmmeMemoRadiSam system protein B [Deltaproteobacteria bacterium]|nr:AmmeMemoRadiSam system protein B [Deltaproteobacteria bacterium]
MADSVPPQVRALNAQSATIQGRSMIVVEDPLGLSPQPALLPPPAYFVMTLLDGVASLSQIRAVCQAQFGQAIQMSDIEEVIRQLDEHFFLESPRFQEALTKARNEFARIDHRPASQAGVSYPAEPEEARKTLAQMMSLAESAPAGELIGLIAPHIDFARGGRVYAAAYQVLPRQKGRLYVVLGTAHVVTEERYVICDKDFLTPLGRARTDAKAAGELARLAGGRFTRDILVHRREHSLEFQVLCLQHQIDPQVRILPILCGGLVEASHGGPSPAADPAAQEFLNALAEIIRREEAICVVGADLAHVGPSFGGDEPVSEADLSRLREEDLALLQHAAGIDPEGFYDLIAGERDRRNVCGLAPIYAALRVLPPSQGRILDYGQWRDDLGRGSVTFAALAFSRKG